MDKQVRFIEGLRDRHKNEEIWIIGAGPSLDDFPANFFDNKISIGVNWSGLIAFPKCTYWHGVHIECRMYLRNYRPDMLWKSIILYPFCGPWTISKKFLHSEIRDPAVRLTRSPLYARILDPVEYFGDLTSRPIWMRFNDIRPIPKESFEKIVEQIMARKSDCGYIASQTIAHTAIEAAVVMGAKRITLVGCEHRRINGVPRARKYGLDKFYTPHNRTHKWWKPGTVWLAELLGEHGIEVIKYFNAETEFYEKGYQKIQG